MEEFLNKNYLITKELIKQGLSKYEIKKNINNNKWIKIKKGFYRKKDAFEDFFYEMSFNNEGIVFSHENALFFNELMEREPKYLNLTVKQGYNVKHLKNNPEKIHYVSEKVHKLGIIEKETIFGNKIKTYDPEKTICDIIKNKNKIESEVFVTALHLYKNLENKQIWKLKEYSKIMNIEKEVQEHMELILW